MNNRANIFENATSDSINSEFFHQIFFSDKKEPMEGASGKVGYREKKGSANNFINYVLRLMKTRYYPGSNRKIIGIIFYRTYGQERVVRMYPEKIHWEPKYLLDPEWDMAVKVIDVMYDLINKKWPLEKIQDHLMIKRKVTEFFNPNDLTEKHANPEALKIYCRHLVKIGYPQGEVEHYYRKYMEKYFSDSI